MGHSAGGTPGLVSVKISHRKGSLVISVRSSRSLAGRVAAGLAGAAAVGALAFSSPAAAAAADASWTMGTGYPVDQDYCFSNMPLNLSKNYNSIISGSWDKPITFGVKDLPGGYSFTTTLQPGSNESTVNAWVAFNIPMQPDGVYHPVVYATDGTTTQSVTRTLTVGLPC